MYGIFLLARESSAARLIVFEPIGGPAERKKERPRLAPERRRQARHGAAMTPTRSTPPLAATGTDGRAVTASPASLCASLVDELVVGAREVVVGAGVTAVLGARRHDLLELLDADLGDGRLGVAVCCLCCHVTLLCCCVAYVCVGECCACGERGAGRSRAAAPPKRRRGTTPTLAPPPLPPSARLPLPFLPLPLRPVLPSHRMR